MSKANTLSNLRQEQRLPGNLSCYTTHECAGSIDNNLTKLAVLW